MQRLGRYHLSDCLGGGPTGEVYRANVYGVAGIDRQFAVKRFHASLVANPKAALELAAAARMYGALEHPRVARLHEFGEAGGHTFTATEYVPGLDLAQLIDQGQLGLGTAARLLVQIGRAVGYAHGRGLSHLGLCPTNILCTERGEIKVTDFGMLPPRLPASPIHDDSLRLRLCYLAPEQLDGGPTSPATDVYQLGTIAYELMVGSKPYRGKNNEELAHQMTHAPVPETGLPRPYDSLLRRALATSPFERFPDAGTMADALEAALRSSPAPGGPAEAGASVAARLEALAGRREQQASGALSFPIPAPPSAPREEVLEQVATPPPVPMAPPKATRTPGQGIAKIKLAKTVMSRVPAIPPIQRTSPAENETYGGDSAITAVGDFKDDTTTLGVPTTEEMPTAVRPDLLDDEVDLSSSMELGPSGTGPSVARQDLLGGVDSAYTPPDEAPTRVKHPARAESLDDEQTTVRDPNAEEPDVFTLVEDDLSEQPQRRNLESTLGDLEPVAVQPAAAPLPQAYNPNSNDPSSNEQSMLIQIPPGAPESVPIPPLPSAESGFGSRAHRVPAEVLSEQARTAAKAAPKSKALPLLLLGMLVAGGAFFAYQRFLAEEDSGTTTAKVTTNDAAIVIPAVEPSSDAANSDLAKLEDGSAIAANVSDASAVAAVAIDAGSTAAIVYDAAPVVVAVAEQDAAPQKSSTATTAALPGKLRIESSPAGAKVYLDGTMVGTTPVELDASTDSHRLALLQAGYDLYTGNIDGTGKVNIELAEVTPPGGPGGIKVRCRAKNRYYVFVDGDPVGELCPSERIGVSKGPHVVEIYDPLTDSRRKFNVDVVDTRLSLRVKVD